jgi:hypothetical protein
MRILFGIKPTDAVITIFIGDTYMALFYAWVVKQLRQLFLAQALFGIVKLIGAIYEFKNSFRLSPAVLNNFNTYIRASKEFIIAAQGRFLVLQLVFKQLVLVEP